MKPTPEQIKQMAIECGAEVWRSYEMPIHLNEEQLQAFFTRAYELGWKNRGESDAKLFELDPSMENYEWVAESIRNNTGE